MRKADANLPRTHARVIRIHTCSVCDKEGTWSDTWAWRGSWKTMDNGDPVIKVCSDACLEEAERRLRGETLLS